MEHYKDCVSQILNELKSLCKVASVSDKLNSYDNYEHMVKLLRLK